MVSSAAAEPGGDPAPAGRPVVLVVEDEVMLRVAVCLHLRTAGFTVIEASNADDAVRVIESTGPLHLVFSDVNMPGSMDGNGLARWIRHTRPSIRLLLTSGRDSPPEGPFRFVDKPYTFEGLVETIRAMLERD